MFSCICRSARVFSKSILCALLLNAVRCKASNVSKSVDGFKHLTRNVSVICITLSVSCELSTFLFREEFPGLQSAFRAAGLVEILLVESHPVNAWSSRRHFINSSFSAAQTSCSGKI